MIEQRTKKIVVIGILAAVAFVVSMFSFPILYWAPFLKIDFSDIIILLGMYVFGPIAGVGIAAVRSLLSYVTAGGEAGFPIGDTTAFIASLSYTLPIYYMIRSKKASYKKSIFASITSTASLTVVMTLLNWTIVAPFYMRVMGFSVGPMREYLTISVIPFNLLKGILVSVVFFIVYYQLHDYLVKLKNNNSPLPVSMEQSEIS